METTTVEPLKLDVRARWEGQAKTAVYVRDFPPLFMDEPPAMGGGDAGPSPMEYVLAALCGCTAIILKMVAKEIGVAIAGIEISAGGTIDPRGFQGNPRVRDHFQQVTERVSLTTDASPERLEELKKAWADRCPAYNLLKDAGINMNVEWDVHRA
ncbi:MAG: OsmC family protein [Bacillota bacterium]